MKLRKYEGNPILVPNQDNDWESLCVLNPAVYYNSETKKFEMLYRAAGNDTTHYIHLGLALSDDGFIFKRQFDFQDIFVLHVLGLLRDKFFRLRSLHRISGIQLTQ